MNRSVLRLTILGLTVAIAAGCADQAPQPSEPSSIPFAAPATPSMLAYAIPSCPSTRDSAQKFIDNFLPQLFAPGDARRGKAQGYSNNMEQARENNNATTADTYADSLINFTLQQYYSGQLLNQGSDLEGAQQRLVSFITYIYCYNGYSPLPDFDLLLSAQNSVLIRNGTPTTVVTSTLGDAGVKVDQGDVPTSVFGTYVSIVKTTDPLPTSLDWYGIDGYKAGAFEFIADPAVVFTDAVLAGVCISYDDAIVTSVADLRLAHTAPTNPADVAPGNHVVTTAGGSIEIGDPESTSPLGLSCDPLPVASRSSFGRALQQFASVFLPEYLAAVTKGGSVGTTVKTFSPFAVVDTKLDATGTGPAPPQYIPVGNTSISASASVAVKTRHDDTPITGIKVAFKPFASFAPDSVPTAGVTGTASSTWTLVGGTNNGTAEPAVPLGFTSAVTFSVNAVQQTTLNFVGPATVPNGVVNAAYTSQTFTANGGAGAGTYSWAVTVGSLPAGLTLNSTTGVLSGTPTATGSFSFTVTVSSGTQTASRAYSMTVALPPVTSIILTFSVAPTKSRCYAVNVPMTPGIVARVTDQSGNLLTGVTVNIVGVTNNGAKVAVSPSSAVSSGGFASFGGPTINKTGGYALLVSTTAPRPASITSAKFTISPSC